MSQNIIIPADVSNQIIDFNNATLTSLTVEGDNDTLSNATIEALTVSKDVFDLTLDNIKDTLGSSHTFDGGGGQSIKLSGDTTFKGEIRITSGEDIRVRAVDGSNAKIEGTILVESGATTKINVPVSNVVLDSDNEVIIDGKVDQLVARKNSKIQLGDNAEVGTIQKRIGTEVSVVDQNGNEKKDVQFKEVLDTTQLTWDIGVAEDLDNHAVTGDKNGNYSLEDKQKLEDAINKAKTVRDTMTSVDQQTQDAIDAATADLENSINTFKQSAVHVDRTALYNKWTEAEKIVHLIAADNIENQYSTELYDHLVALVEQAKQLYETYEVSQDQLNSEVASIQEAMDQLEASRNTTGGDNPYTQGAASIKITGAGIIDNQGSISFYPINQYGSSIPKVQPKYESKLIDGGIQFDLTGIDPTESTTFYAVIQTNGYLFIEKFSQDEVKNGTVRNIKVDDSYVPVKVSLPYTDVKYQNILLNVLDENGKAILTTNVSEGTKIPSGTYNVQYVGRGSNASYGFFKDNVTLNQQNSTIAFSNDDAALVKITMDQKNPVNYQLVDFSPLYWGDRKYDTIWGVNIGENVNSVYISKLQYDALIPGYSINQDQVNWEIRFNMNKMNIQSDTELNVNDDLMVKAQWNPSFDNHQIDINTQLFQYLDNVSISNTLDQEARIYKWSQSDYSGLVNGKIVINVNGKEFIKDLKGLDLSNLTVKDIIGDDKVTGDATLELRVDDSPIPVTPYTQAVTLVNNN